MERCPRCGRQAISCHCDIGSVLGCSVYSRSSFIPFREGPSQVRYGYGSAYNQGDGHDFLEFLIGHAYLLTPYQMILDAVVTSQNRRGHEPKHLLRFDGKSTFPVCVRVYIEKTFDVLTGVLHEYLVEILPFIHKIRGEFFFIHETKN